MQVPIRIILMSATFLFGMHFAQANDSIDIVAFDAENLFDTVDDIDNPRDDTYLPLIVKVTMQTSHNQKRDQLNGIGSTYVKQCKTLDWNLATYNQRLKRYGDVPKARSPTPYIMNISATETLNSRVALLNFHYG